MRHEVCPATMTFENLADWIKSNKVDVTNHIEKFPLTEEEINEFQKSSSLASRQIDKLKDTMKYFQELIKNGTPWDNGTENHRPVSVTIPPTQGIKVLEANRKFADRQLENGYREQITPIYFIPWPEFEKLVAVDILGEEWSKYSRKMTQDEVLQHGKPILRASQDIQDIMENSGIEVEKVEGKTVKLRKKRALDSQPPLSEEEKQELGEGDGEDLNL